FGRTAECRQVSVSTLGKRSCGQRGRRDSNPQPPDRQGEDDGKKRRKKPGKTNGADSSCTVLARPTEKPADLSRLLADLSTLSEDTRRALAVLLSAGLPSSPVARSAPNSDSAGPSPASTDASPPPALCKLAKG